MKFGRFLSSNSDGDGTPAFTPLSLVVPRFNVEPLLFPLVRTLSGNQLTHVVKGD